MNTGKLRLNIGNLDDVQDGFAPIPEGIYKMQVQSADLTTSKQGNQMVKLTLVITDADPEKQQYLGRKGFANLVVVPDALWKLKQFCKAAGIGWDAGGVNLEPAIGKELNIKVTQEPYTDPSGSTRITNRFDEFVVPA